MTERTCGTCNLCCKVLGIKELNKPTNQWCPHAKPKQGCGIYNDRPPSCRSFMCAWMGRPDLVPEFLKPDKVHGFFTTLVQGEGVALHLDPGYPMAHQQQPLKGALDNIAEAGLAIVVTCGTKILHRAGTGWIRGRITSLDSENGLTNVTVDDPDDTPIK